MKVVWEIYLKFVWYGFTYENKLTQSKFSFGPQF